MRPSHLPSQTTRFSGQIPVKFEGLPGGPFAGEMKLRGLRDFEHSSLCRAFGLDQASFWFDVASTARGVGSNTGHHPSSRRQIDGFVFMAGRDTPVARLRVVRDDERLWDFDPTHSSDYERLDRVW